MEPARAAEYGLFDYWTIARKRWPWVLVPVALFSALAAAYSLNEEDRYQATTLVLLSDSESERILDPRSQNTGFLSRELSNEVSLAQSDSVVRLVVDQLGYLPDVTIRSDSDADVLSFIGEANDPADAALFANTWADKYLQVKREGVVEDIAAAADSIKERLVELRTERQALREPLDQLDDRIQRSANPETAARLQSEYIRLADDLRYELELVTSQAEAAVGSLTDLELQAEVTQVGKVVQEAAPPTNRSNTPLSRNIALGLLLGLMAGFGLALLAETRDKTIKSASDMTAITDVPVLASIPAASKKQQANLAFATYSDPEGMWADSYHKVRSSLEFVSFEKDIKTVLVTSPNPAEGKTTTSSNLALALSSIGRRTVLLDVDYRRARLHQIFDIDQMPGMSDVVLNGAEMRSVAYSVKEPGLRDLLLVVPTGTVPPSPAAFVGTSGFLSTLDGLKTQADVVVMDAPPMLAVSDAHTLGKHVDGVIITVKAGQTTKGEISETLSVLAQTGANVIGIVLVGVEGSDTYGRQYYYRSGDTVTRSKANGSKQSLWTDRLDSEARSGEGLIDITTAPTAPQSS